jgi:hypothetical protein
MNSIVHFTFPEISHGLVAIVVLAIVAGGLFGVAIMAMFVVQTLKKRLLRIGRPSVSNRGILSTASGSASAR